MKHFGQLYQKIYSDKLKIGISIASFIAISYVVLFIQSFDLYGKGFYIKTLIFFGFVLSIMIICLSLLAIQQLHTLRLKNKPTIFFQVCYFTSLLVITCYLFMSMVIKTVNFSIHNFFTHTTEFIIPFSIIFFPAIVYMRNRYDRINLENDTNSKNILLRGDGKKDELLITKDQLLYVKADNNYVKIYYSDTKMNVCNYLMRCTLTKISEQIPDVIRCHRSYLIAPWNCNDILGNSQKSCIQLKDTKHKIPISVKKYKMVVRELKVFKQDSNGDIISSDQGICHQSVMYTSSINVSPQGTM